MGNVHAFPEHDLLRFIGMHFPRHLLALLFLILLTIPVQAEIVEVCPNCGEYEYVKVNVTCDDAVLTDGEGKIPLSRGFFVIAKNSTEFFRKFGYHPDVEARQVDRRFMLSNQGEKIRLLCGDAIEDELAYGKAGYGYTSHVDRDLVYFRAGEDGWDFKYIDWTNFKPVADEVYGRIVIFPNELKIEAEESLVLASYTLRDDLNLKKLAEKGVEIELYLDASPVGGIPLEEAELIRDLLDDEVQFEVHFLSSNSYENFHYKFAVIDGRRVIITTENWKTSNRGYLIEFESEKIANLLVRVVEHDKIYSSKAGRVSRLHGFEKSVISAGSTEFSGEVEVFVLPDHNPIFDLISSSKEELLIAAPYLDLTWFGTDEFLKILKSACESGAKVRVLLDSKHSKERNEKLVRFLNRIAEREGYNLEAKLITLKGFESLHGKMIYSDGKCIITSANFNEYGLKLNREIGVLIYDERACKFLRDQFYEDWKDRFKLINIPKISSSFSTILTLLSFVIAHLYLKNLYLKRK